MTSRQPTRLLLAHRHGRRAGPRGAADPGRRGVHRRAGAARRPFLVLTNNSIYTAARPARPAARPAASTSRRTRSGPPRWPPPQFLDDQRPGGIGVRHRRGRADHGPARDRLRADRPRPRLRGARRDPDLLVRGDHHGHPADRGRRPVHRHQSRRHRAVPEGPLPAAGSVAALITKATGRSRTSSASPTR